MVREVEHAETKNDFKHKMGVAKKEINETIYWLELLKETGYISQDRFEIIHSDAVEIFKIITSIIRTTKNNLKQ